MRGAADSAMALLWLLCSNQPLIAATPEEMYVEALANERNLRSSGHVPVTLLEWRDAANRYESIVREYPRSGFSDNALWQAAGLAIEAFERADSEIDRRNGTRLLTLLAQEYPTSPLIPRISDRLGILASMPNSTKSASVSHVHGVTRDVFGDFVRVTIELDGEVGYRVERLAGPDRLYFDLLSTSVDTSLLNTAFAFEDGDVIRKIRLGRHPENTTRVVLDLNDVESYDVYALYNPYRLVVDTTRTPVLHVQRTTASRRATGFGHGDTKLAPLPSAESSLRMQSARQDIGTGRLSAPSVPIPDDPPQSSGHSLMEHGREATRVVVHGFELPAVDAVAPEDRYDILSDAVAPEGSNGPTHSLARQLGLKVASVVVDPGHGGYDPGAQKGGLDESRLVLDVALRLERMLKAEGVDIVLTRRDDVYVSLRGRAKIANQTNADLFLSIHVNAAPDPKIRGIETYYLGFTDDPAAQTLAVRENAATSDGMHDLDDLVRTIATHDKVNESQVFAGLVQRRLIFDVGGVYPTVQDLGVKRAPFMVLLGAEMPSALAEVSFLTNEEDARFLATDAYREQIAAALFVSIMEYQDTLERSPGSAAENN